MSSRRIILTGLLVAAAVPFTFGVLPVARAADAFKIGILIPGSKTDKGWMESSYDGLVAAQKQHGDPVQGPDQSKLSRLLPDAGQEPTDHLANDCVIGVGSATRENRFIRLPNVFRK